MRISSTGVIEGRRVLYTIGRIKAASAWHAASGSPSQDNWREVVLSELIREAEDIDADAIIGLGYRNDSPIRNEETGVNLKRVVATGTAVKLSCAA
jgi:Putative heavy-metal-binding